MARLLTLAVGLAALAARSPTRPGPSRPRVWRLVPAEVPSMVHVFAVENFLPTSANKLLRMHWSARRKALAADALVVRLAALSAGVPRAAGRRRLSAAFRGWPRGRAGDPDNLLKSSLDALVGCGLLLDDGPAGLKLAGASVERAARPASVFTLEDLA